MITPQREDVSVFGKWGVMCGGCDARDRPRLDVACQSNVLFAAACMCSHVKVVMVVDYMVCESVI